DIRDNRLVLAREIIVEPIDELLTGRCRSSRIGRCRCHRHVSVDLVLHKHNVMKSILRTTLRGVAVIPIVLATTLVGRAQTVITPPDNCYGPAQDVGRGREAAAQARQQLPVLRDDNVSSYVDDVGRRLVAAVPPDLRHAEFRYTFEPVNVREINAFALP